MGYSAPDIKQVVQKTPDPVINMGDAASAVRNQRNKRGLLSTFMGNSSANNRSSGFLANMINKTNTLGNQPTD